MKKWLFLLLGILIVALGGFTLWAETPLGPMPQALEAMHGNAYVNVLQANFGYVFQPSGVTPDTGLIFYPGGRVDARAYAPQAEAIAAQGYLVVIVPMPLNLAVIAPDKATQVIVAYPSIRHWAIGGHSLGGAMAASYVYNHPEAVQGLVFWAAYPASNNDLSKSSLSVVSIFGTSDGLATGEKIEASRTLLPADTVWIAIEGGNHAQMGWYGPQGGDNQASISREMQQVQIVDATVALLNSLSGRE